MESLCIRGAIRRTTETTPSGGRKLRVHGANALLDRAYGKPAVEEETEIVDLPPVVIEVVGQSAD